ncbi:MAG: ATP-binding protein [Defluviitaleaceae bacterium]|nr:ATP-binding protein [Defluviitaleaceae bacterium]
MDNKNILSAEILFGMINNLDDFIYITNPDDDTILFLNKSIKRHFNIDDTVIGKKCYRVFQEGQYERCDFCACHQLEKDPTRTVVWVEHNSLVKRSYRNTDTFIVLEDGSKFHMNHSIEITNRLKRDKMMQAVNRAAALLLVPDYKDDIETPLVRGMELIGRSIEADRVHIWRNVTVDGELFYQYTYGWFNREDDPFKEAFYSFRLSANVFPEWGECFARGEYVGGSVSNMSEREREFFEKYSVKSVIILPLYLNDEFWGYFCVDDWNKERVFEPEEVTILRSISLMMANAISQNMMINRMNEAHERSMLMLDTSPLCTQIWAKDLSTIDCNMAGVKLYGFKDKQEYIDRFITSCSPEFQPCGRRSDEKAVALVYQAFEEGIVRFDWMHKMPDEDTLIPADITLVRSMYKDQEIVLGYTRDMREQNALMEKLNEEGRKFEEMAHWYRSILDAIPLMVSATDKDMNWRFANKALGAFADKTPEQLEGQPCHTLGTHICNTAECGVGRAKRGLKQTFFDHGGFSFQVDVEILRDLEGEISGFIEVVQNITHVHELMRQRTDAEMANQTKSSFLASMSHEIRTPMNAILGVTEILIENSSTDKDMLEGLNKIYNSGNLLLGIINDILDLSKIEAGKMDILSAPYNVAELIGDSAHLNAMRIDSKPIAFDVLPDMNIPAKLIGDELRIKQILNNVLSNAFKYTDKGTVTFSINTEPLANDTAERNGVMLVLGVRDTGLGMTETQLKKLFEEYSRFEEGTSRGIEGTGLGLAITKRLVHLMDGEVRVESEYGKGSFFEIKLPQKTVDDEVLGEETAENIKHFRMVQMGRMEKGHIIREPMPYGNILVVDDIEPNLYVAEGLMKPYGLTIEKVMSGEEAINKVMEGNVYDIIFMDHMMPGMDGIEATIKLREHGYKEPIVALTANALAGQANVFFQNGFNEFISKPIDTRQLNQVLNKFVRDKQPPEVIEAARLQAVVLYAPPKDASLLIDALRTIEGLDVAAALALLGGMYEVYEDTVRLSARLIPITVKKMDEYLAAGNLKSFAIEVHGLKGVTRSIGAVEIAATAGRLEIAALNNGKDFCNETYPDFREAVMEFIDDLNAALEKEPPTIKEAIDTATLLIKIESAKNAAEGYDAMSALDIAKPLLRFTFGEEGEALLEHAVFALEEFDCQGAAEKLEEILNTYR